MAKNAELLGISAFIALFWGGMATLCRLLFSFSGYIVIGITGIAFIISYVVMLSIQGVDD